MLTGGSKRSSILTLVLVLAVLASAPPAWAQSVSSPRFKLDLLGQEVPDVRAAAAIIYNPQTNQVIWGENQHEQRPIASLTKLMTAVTFMAGDPDLDERVTVASSDVRRASVTYLRSGEIVSYRELLHLTLIASDNGAARAIARTSEGGTAAFVARMNAMATTLGLTSTRYADPSGLDADNVSSAYDISHLIPLLTSHSVLGPIVKMKTHVVQTNRRRVTIRSTNRLLDVGAPVIGGKTGYIRKAGYCLATLFQVPEGSQVAVVVLGATNSSTRFWEARHLLNWFVDRAQGQSSPSGR